MSIKRTIITTVVGLTLVALVAPGVAQGVTIAELQAQINALLAQLQLLQGGSTPSGNVPAVCAGVTFTRNLTVGATGSDVKCLQAILNMSATTQVATTGAGSPGGETSYFGGLTLAAVKKYQAEHGWTPANQVGPLTRAALNATLGGGVINPPITPTGAGLTVQLASNNPASGTIVDTQALYPLARLTFTNGDNAEVKITGLKLKRTGVSADASLVNTYLFDGVTRLTDGAAVSTTVINFNNTAGVFTVPAGGSKTISVLSDVNGSASETFGVQVVASTDVTTNASSVKGSFPISSNLHTLASGTLAGAEFNATTSPASAATIDPQNDYTVWQNSVVVTTRAVDLTRISFRKTGSVKDADIQNFRLYVDGVQVGSAVPNIVLNSNNESLVTFDLTGAPKRMEAGTRVIKLLADIIGGSSLTFTFNLWNSADVTVVDSQYLANVLPDLVSDATFTKRSTAEQTIGSGSLTITKMSDSPSGDVVNGASNALLAKFQLKAAGERVKIETLYVSATVSTALVSGLRNGALYANGVQIGSTTTLYDEADTTYDYTTFSLGSSLIVEPGNPVTLEVKADVYYAGSATTALVAGTTTIQVVIEGSASWNNGTGMVSASTIDVPASDVSGNSLTVKEGGLTLSKDPSYTDQVAVAPVTAFKLAAFNLTAKTTEAVNITAINVSLDDVSSYASNLYVKYGSKVTSTQASITTASKTWSINEVLAAGATLPIEVYVDVSSTMTSGTGVATLDVDGTTVSSAATADSASTTAGQTITFSSGAFTAAFASTPSTQVVRGGNEVEIGRWKFTSSYQQYTIQEVKIDPDKNTSPGTSDNAEDAFVTVTLKDGSTVLQTQSYNAVDTSGSTGGYYFTGLNVVVPASTSKTLTAVATVTIPSTTAGNSGLRVIPALTYAKYMDTQGTVSTITDSTGDLYEANSTYVYRTVPTLSLATTPVTNTFTNGQEVDLYSFKITAPSYTYGGVTYGDVHIKQFQLNVTWSDAVTADVLELESLKFYKDGVDYTSSVTIREEDTGSSVESTTGVTEGNNRIIVTWDGDTEDTISAAGYTTYMIKGTPTGFVTLGATDTTHDSVTLQLVPDSADVTFGNTTVDYIGYINTDTLADANGILKLYTSATAHANAEAAQLIWSDDSAVAHSASTTAGTGDWTSGYLLNSIPAVTWTK